MLITSVKRDRRASRQERKKQNNKIKKKTQHTHTHRQWHLGQAQGKQAVQRQAGSEHPASHKAAFSYRKKNNKKQKGFTERARKKVGAFGDLLEQHFAACRGIKGGHIASPWRTGDCPSVSPLSNREF